MRIVRSTLAALLAVAAILFAAAPATAAIDPSASAVLASALKEAMKKKLKSVRGLVVTRTTCYVPTTSKLISGKCTVKFTVARVHLDGRYQAKATLDSRSRLTYTASAPVCTDSRTHKRIAC